MRKMCVLTWLLSATLLAAGAGYHVTGEIKIGGEGGWDYATADSAARRLYVSHATHVAVVDLDKGMVVGDIPDTPGVHGAGFSTKAGHGFTTNGGDQTVTMFDLKSSPPSRTARGWMPWAGILRKS